jgi:2',3'-cyclic-nucleotide 2'-phosphodiesterase/3'-nucleotidase
MPHIPPAHRPATVLFAAALLAAFAMAASARLATITILCTADLHGSVRATPGRYLDHNEGSLLQLATLVKRVRAETPNVLLLDAGDIFQGTAESLLSGGEAVAIPMNALGYSAFAVGNHEFDWGVDEAGRLLSLLDATPLAANLLRAPGSPRAFDRVRPWTVCTVDGIRVGIVGLTNPNLNQWFRDMAPAGLRAGDSRKALERCLPGLRRKEPQILVLLAHQALQAKDDAANEINAIGARFGEFDLILGAHVHRPVKGARAGFVDYAQCGAGATGILRADLDYDTVSRRVAGKRFEWIPVTPDVPEDPGIRAAVAPFLDRTDREMATVLGLTERPLTASMAAPGLSPVQQLFCRAIAEATGADVVLHGVFSTISVPAGPVTVADTWRLVPYENFIGTAELTPAEIREILEESVPFLGTARYLSAWGLSCEIHTYAPPGERIRNLRRADGSPLHGRQRIRVAINSYHLSGGGGRFPRLAELVAQPHAGLAMHPLSMRAMVAGYIQSHSPLDIPPGTTTTVIRTPPKKWVRKPAP